MTASNRLLLTASTLGVAVLLALGTWQVQRLQWKLDIIDKRQQALVSQPVTLADIEAGIEHGFDVDWLKVKATGSFRHDLERHFYDLRGGKIGWRILTPFVAPGRFIVMVDRGFVPDELKDAKTRRPAGTEQAASSPVEIVGFVRTNAGPAGMFTPANDPVANRWYSIDLMAMAETLPEDLGFVEPNAYAAMLPVLLQLAPDKGAAGQGLPIVDPVNVELRNNHVQYAVTWYGLALVLIVLTVLFYRSRTNAGKQEDPQRTIPTLRSSSVLPACRQSAVPFRCWAGTTPP
ncbi:MAG: SURF1 family protein [Aestuariivirgaceae bacterium]